MKVKIKKAYKASIQLNNNFITKYASILTKNAIVIYLHILSSFYTESDFTLDEIADKLNVSADSILDEILVLEKYRLISIKGDTLSVLLVQEILPERPMCDRDNEITPEDVEALPEKDFAFIRNVAEQSFSKLLSLKEVNRLVEMVNWLNIPVEVLAIIIEFVGKSEKKSLAYVEKIAVDWSEKGITTVQKAHNYIGLMESRNNLINKIRSKFMMFDRPISKKDREYLDSWQGTYTEEEIFNAFEVTINSTSKLSFAYTDKVLKNSGKPYAPAYKQSVKTPKGKFNNFKQDEREFDDIEKRARDKLFGLIQK